MLNSLLPCKFIYSIDYQHGTLFALALSKQTYVGPMEDQILYLDKSMQASCGSTSTRFTSISDRLSGKIKTFGKGEYMSDEHYTAIFPTEVHFGRRGQTVRVHSGVGVWSSPLNSETQTNDEESADDENDDTGILDQANPSSKGKERASGSAFKRMRISDDDGGGGCSAGNTEDKEEIHSLRNKLEDCNGVIEGMRVASGEEQSLLKKEVEVLHQQLHESKESYAKDILALQQQIEFNASSQEQSLLRKELDDAKNAIDVLQQQKEFKSNEAYAKGVLEEQQQKLLSEENSEKVLALQKQLTESKTLSSETIRELEKKLFSTDTRMKTYEKGYAEVSLSIEGYVKKIDELGVQLFQSNAKSEELGRKMKRLAASKPPSESEISKALENMTAQVESQRHELELYSIQVTKIEETCKEEVAYYCQQRDDLFPRLETAETEVRQYKKEIVELKKAGIVAPPPPDVEAVIRQLTKDLETSRAEVENLQKEIAYRTRMMDQYRAFASRAVPELIADWTFEDYSRALQEQKLSVGEKEREIVRISKELKLVVGMYHEQAKNEKATHELKAQLLLGGDSVRERAHTEEVAALKHKFRVEKDSILARLDQVYKAQFCNLSVDNETIADFYKRKYHSLLVCDGDTGEPILCKFSGEVMTKDARYRQQKMETMVELESVKKLLPSAEMVALLGRAQLKGRSYKRKYNNIKTYLREEQYIAGIDDKFCESDKYQDVESDDDLRTGADPRRVYEMQDVALPGGFSLRPASPE